MCTQVTPSASWRLCTQNTWWCVFELSCCHLNEPLYIEDLSPQQENIQTHWDKVNRMSISRTQPRHTYICIKRLAYSLMISMFGVESRLEIELVCTGSGPKRLHHPWWRRACFLKDPRRHDLMIQVRQLQWNLHRWWRVGQVLAAWPRRKSEVKNTRQNPQCTLYFISAR